MISTMIKKTQIEMVGTEKSNVFEAKGFNLWYGNDHALKDIEFDIAENNVTAIIGPSGCGKSTFMKSLNRMVELIPISENVGRTSL